VSPYNGSGIAERRTRTIDHAAPRPETVQQRWKHFPHQADIDARGIGSTKAAAFESAAHALTAVITDLGSVAPTHSVPIVCEAPDDELLLVDWLNALVYEMATRKL
jgi:SHS2 domain-containing protein